MFDINKESLDIREKINNAINEIVICELAKKDASVSINDIKERIEDETGITKSQVAKYAALRFKQLHLPDKYEADKEWFDSCFQENEMLGS